MFKQQEPKMTKLRRHQIKKMKTTVAVVRKKRVIAITRNSRGTV